MQDNHHSHDESSTNPYHLEYLDQFLQLKCAPDLLAMGLFPNSKEITESFACWTAVRQHILPRLAPSTSKTDRQNAIIVVGDGMTPRTGALCAFLSKSQWQCFSIDPILAYDSYADMKFIPRRCLTTAEHCEEWKTVQCLRMARAKIQTVSIECRRAIIIMMHAHVSIDDAVAAVDASEGIVGLVTCPCCKWAPFQQEFFGQTAHHQYTDLRLLSAKNQMNVWCFPEGYSLNRTNQQLTERSSWGVDTSTMEHVLSNRDGVKQRAMDLWPKIFSHGVRAFYIQNENEISDDSNSWPWGSTVWSPRDIISLIQSCNPLPAVSVDESILPSWFAKPVLLVGTIGAMRRCKHTIFYELNSCSISSEETNKTLPELLKTADQMWTYIEYQQHRQAVTAFDATAERKAKKQNAPQIVDADRAKILLSTLAYENKTHSTDVTDVQEKRKIFDRNPQPQQSLFPWAISLRPGDILVAYCQLGRNASYGPILCLVDGVLLFDSKLHIFGVDRRILR